MLPSARRYVELALPGQALAQRRPQGLVGFRRRRTRRQHADVAPHRGHPAVAAALDEGFVDVLDGRRFVGNDDRQGALLHRQGKFLQAGLGRLAFRHVEHDAAPQGAAAGKGGGPPGRELDPFDGAARGPDAGLGLEGFFPAIGFDLLGPQAARVVRVDHAPDQARLGHQAFRAAFEQFLAARAEIGEAPAAVGVGQIFVKDAGDRGGDPLVAFLRLAQHGVGADHAVGHSVEGVVDLLQFDDGAGVGHPHRQIAAAEAPGCGRKALGPVEQRTLQGAPGHRHRRQGDQRQERQIEAEAVLHRRQGDVAGGTDEQVKLVAGRFQRRQAVEADAPLATRKFPDTLGGRTGDVGGEGRLGQGLAAPGFGVGITGENDAFLVDDLDNPAGRQLDGLGNPFQPLEGQGGEEHRPDGPVVAEQGIAEGDRRLAADPVDEIATDAQFALGQRLPPPQAVAEIDGAVAGKGVAEHAAVGQAAAEIDVIGLGFEETLGNPGAAGRIEIPQIVGARHDAQQIAGLVDGMGFFDARRPHELPNVLFDGGNGGGALVAVADERKDDERQHRNRDQQPDPAPQMGQHGGFKAVGIDSNLTPVSQNEYPSGKQKKGERGEYFARRIHFHYY